MYWHLEVRKILLQSSHIHSNILLASESWWVSGVVGMDDVTFWTPDFMIFPLAKEKKQSPHYVYLPNIKCKQLKEPKLHPTFSLQGSLENIIFTFPASKIRKSRKEIEEIGPQYPIKMLSLHIYKLLHSTQCQGFFLALSLEQGTILKHRTIWINLLLLPTLSGEL